VLLNLRALQGMAMLTACGTLPSLTLKAAVRQGLNADTCRNVLCSGEQPHICPAKEHDGGHRRAEQEKRMEVQQGLRCQA